ncbi:MAG: efflux RND transporter periplasmic adaptor subunit [Alphaproteobacteria bacterium]
MKQSYLIAFAVSALLVLWMLPGLLGFGKKSAETKSPQQNALMAVEIEEQDSKPVISFIVAQGNVTPNREVTLRAETTGKVKEILSEEGQDVKESDIILRLDMEDRQIRLERARARLTEMKRKFDAAKSLAQKGYAAQSRTDEALAQLKEAQTEEQQIMLEIGDTEIRAPFDGILDKRNVEIGDFVNIGDNIVTIVDNTPLVVNVPVPQKEIGEIALGGNALIKIAGGKETGGMIRFIAPKADESTRTFRVKWKYKTPPASPREPAPKSTSPRKASRPMRFLRAS